MANHLSNPARHRTEPSLVKALPRALLLAGLAATSLSAHADPFDDRLSGLLVGAGIGAQVSSIEVDGGTPADDVSGGVSFALIAGYGLDERTALTTAFHYVHHDDSERSRGIGLLGLGARHHFGADPRAWYVDGLIGHAFVTDAFERGEADELDEDDFAEGAGVRLAVGRGLGRHLQLEGALMGVAVDGGHLPPGAEIETSSTQLQLTYLFY